MEGIAIQPKHVFGVKADVTGCIHHIEDSRVVYSAGHNVVVYNTEYREMNFYPGLEGSWGISSMAVSLRKRYLAVAERAERAIVTVYDLNAPRKKRILVTSDCQSNEYVSMAFAPNQEKKYLITMGGKPDWVLVFWQWDRPRVISTTKVSNHDPVYQISFNIMDYQLGIIATGNKVLRGYKPGEGILKPFNPTMNKKEAHLSNHYTCHSWLNDGKLVIGTDNGEILLFDQNTEYRGYFSCGLENWSANCIIPYSNGFLVAGEEARIIIFERSTEDLRMHYMRSNRVLCISSQAQTRIQGISIAPQNEETIVVVLDNQQIYSLSLTSEKEETEPLGSPLHTDTINGLDVCIRKPLLVTCGLDNSIRIWNYMEKTLEVVEFFGEVPYSVAFHPSGFHIVVGFADKLRMMNIFANCIKSYKDIHIKACREVVFSHGGHLFAATNGHLIQVFNFYTGENPPHMQFKGHSAKVSSLYWGEDDNSLVSVGWDGGIFIWNICSRSEQANAPQLTQKGIKFTSGIYTADSRTGEGQSIMVTGGDREIKEIQRGNCIRHLETGSIIGQLRGTQSGRLLLAGLAESEKPGALRAYKFDPMDGEFLEVQAHSKPIERIRISFDDGFIFTVGQDGCLFIFEIKDREYRSLRQAKEGAALPFAEEILITRSEIDDLNKQIEDHQSKAKELEINNKIQSEMALQEKQEEIDKCRQLFMEISQQEMQKYNALMESKNELERIHKERIENMKTNFESEKSELEAHNLQRFNIEVERYQELSKERELEAKAFAETLEKITSKHTKIMAERREDYNAQLESVRQEIDRLTLEKEKIKQEFEERRERLEEQNERQLLEIAEQNVKDVESFTKDSKESKAQFALARQGEKAAKESRDEIQDKVKQKDQELEDQKGKLRLQEEEIKTTKNEIKQRDKTVREKEKRIFELKKKNTELEKFRFVLDYKIRELRKDKGPREDEIARLKEQTSEMEKELKHMEDVNENLGLLVDDLKMRQDGMENEFKSQSTKLKENQSKLKVYREGIYEAVQYIKDDKRLKEEVIKLYNRFVRNETQIKEANAHKDFERQANSMEKNIIGLNEKLKKLNDNHRKGLTRTMNQNVELIKEINVLKKNIKDLEFLKRQVDSMNQNLSKQGNVEEQALREIEMQRDDIRALRGRLAELEAGGQPENLNSFIP